ncbi:Uncharacterised protein [Salmonella enterica subsp. arizonae]|uniref:Uncharacterized protein n=1 Tax=Salmonella enterica subsp. arizonae TaxID=59203 RepID=A0A379SWI5_SALER|nr:Uncharacterised protein [Salmonella enterica subsp. arizonae]
MQLAGIIGHRPVLVEVIINQQGKALKEFQFTSHPGCSVIVQLRITQQQGKYRLRQ